jgi:hypothetical protein
MWRQGSRNVATGADGLLYVNQRRPSGRTAVDWHRRSVRVALVPPTMRPSRVVLVETLPDGKLAVKEVVTSISRWHAEKAEREPFSRFDMWHDMRGFRETEHGGRLIFNTLSRRSTGCRQEENKGGRKEITPRENGRLAFRSTPTPQAASGFLTPTHSR